MTEYVGISWLGALFLLGIYGRIWWMLPGVVVFGIGHIGIHLGYRREAPV
ncbi:hypothetical protein [uncultured Oscillibacter sp.]|jgi:hypothetical protein|nr:hypothetical protein [uncultured Oscillibacter sp.]MCI9553792.1 hypothetical protein [Oscillibacter sp.]